MKNVTFIGEQIIDLRYNPIKTIQNVSFYYRDKLKINLTACTISDNTFNGLDIKFINNNFDDKSNGDEKIEIDLTNNNIKSPCSIPKIYNNIPIFLYLSDNPIFNNQTNLSN